MNRRQVEEVDLTAQALETLSMAALAAGIVLKSEVVGFVLNDTLGISIVPKPGRARWLLRNLQECPWSTLVRSAEEMET